MLVDGRGLRVRVRVCNGAAAAARALLDSHLGDVLNEQMPSKKSPRGKGRNLRQAKLGDATRGKFFQTPRNPDAPDKPLELEETAVEMLTAISSTSGTFERGECSKSVAGESTASPQLQPSGLRCSARFLQSVTGSTPVRVEGQGSARGSRLSDAITISDSTTADCVLLRREGKEAVGEASPGKGTESNPKLLSESQISPGGSKQKGKQKSKGKRKKGDACRSRRWQDSWATDFPWAEKFWEEGGFTVPVKCIPCTRVGGRLKTLCCKRDNLNKHAGWAKAERDMPQPGVKEGEYYRDKESRHYKNEKLFIALSKASVLEQLNTPVEMNWSKKKVPFVVVLNMLLTGRPMTDYSSYRDVLMYLDRPLVPFKHWSVSNG